MAAAAEGPAGVAVVVGSNRGIGLGFVEQLLEKNYKVICTCRNPSSADALKKLQSSKSADRVQIEELDVSKEESIAAFGLKFKDSTFDIGIVNAGIMGTRGPDGNFLSMGNMTFSDMTGVFNVNVIGATLMAQQLYENVRKSSNEARSVVIISSGMGSISECGGNYTVSYRMSKAAVNMAGKVLNLKAIRDGTGVRALTLNPGWVKTDMGGDGASITVDESVKGMLGLILDPSVKQPKDGILHFDGSKTFAY